MLQVIFNFITNISVTAALVALIVIVIKLLFKNKLPASWHYYVWLLIIIRLIVPVSFSSSFSIFNLDYNKHVSTISNKPVFKEVKDEISNINKSGDQPTTINNANSEDTKEKYKEIIKSKSIFIKFFKGANLFAITWLIIGLSLLSYIVFSYVIFLHKIKAYCKESDDELLPILQVVKAELKIKRSIPIYFTDLIKTPCIISVIKPKILIPKDYKNTVSNNEFKYIFLHELIHYNKKDLIFNWVFTLVVIIHWFNPIVWLCFFLMKKDCELCCDFVAMKHLKQNERIEYGEILIKLAEFCSNNRKELMTPGMASIVNKNALKRRIIMIPRFQNTRKRTICLIILVTVATLLILLTDKKVTQSGISDKQIAIASELFDDELKEELKEDKKPSNANIDIKDKTKKSIKIKDEKPNTDTNKADLKDNKISNNDDSNTNKSSQNMFYANGKLGFIMRFPDEWKDKYVIEEHNEDYPYGVKVYFKSKNSDKKECIFYITEKNDDIDEENVENVSKRINNTFEARDIRYIIGRNKGEGPTKNSPDFKEFNKMVGEAENVIDTLEILR